MTKKFMFALKVLWVCFLFVMFFIFSAIGSNTISQVVRGVLDTHHVLTGLLCYLISYGFYSPAFDIAWEMIGKRGKK